MADWIQKADATVGQYLGISALTVDKIVWTSVADIGVTLTIRFLCDPHRRRSAEAAIWEDLLDAFSAVDDVDFAYPTQRFYDNLTEGKAGARASVDPPD